MCQCDQLVAPADDSGSIQLCSICNKRIEAGRPGSLTQWVFRSDICECQTPRPVDFDGIANGAGRESNFPKFESEKDVVRRLLADSSLKVDENSFPLDRYRAISEIGRGASGVVYLAHDLMLQKRVAIKCLKTLTSDQLMSFQKEAQATSKLNHPQIIKIFDFGAARSGAPYMVMEYFDGNSLKSIIDEHGPLSEQVAIPIFASLARALAHAHMRGIFHRDVKNSNVLLRRSGDEKKFGNEIRVIDFGVAAFKESSQAGQLANGVTLVGTPPYMAPDQLRGKPFDARSEVYSLGCLFVEALCGRAPFIGETALETLNMHATRKTPTLAQLNPDAQFSEEIEAIVARCLEKQPEDRFQTMNDLAANLEAMLADRFNFAPEDANVGIVDGGGSPKLEKIDTRLPLPVIVGGLVGLILFAGLGLAVLNREPSEKRSSTSSTYVVSNDDRADQSRKIRNLDSKSEHSSSAVSIADGTDESIQSAANTKQIQILSLERGTFTGNGLQALADNHIESLLISGSHLDESAVRALCNFRFLKRLSIRNCPECDLSPLAAFQGSALKSLALENVKASDASLAFLRNQSQLQELRIIGSGNFTGVSLSAITKLPLRVLSLYNLPKLTDGSFAAISRIASLRELYMAETYRKESESAESYAETEVSHEQLIEMPHEQPVYPEQSFRSLTALPLQSLALDSDKMADRQFASLSSMKSLTELTLCGKQFIPPVRIAEVAKLPNLKSLTVLGPCLERVGLERICAMPKLERLTLFDSELTNTDLNVFPRSSIRALTLAGHNSISDSGLIFLGQMPKLEKLLLPRVTFITPGGREDFIKTKPQCQVGTAER